LFLLSHQVKLATRYWRFGSYKMAQIISHTHTALKAPLQEQELRAKRRASLAVPLHSEAPPLILSVERTPLI
jgi:hypothetical protein